MSQIEAFPIVILEAMASRTPFISTDCGNVEELPGGVVVYSLAEMVEQMQKFSEKGSDWQRLANEGQRAWEQKYHWERIVDEYENLYLGLYEKRRG